MITVDALKEYGADTETGLRLCMGNEALYLRLVGTVPEEACYAELLNSIKAKDYDKAFDAAHALKGVLGNLSLTPLYETVSQMVEFLRKRTDMDYSEMIEDLNKKMDALSVLCK